MISFLTGIIGESWNTTCIIITQGGVGYAVSLPGHTFADLPPKGNEASFYTSLVVREDAFELFGFATLEEKQTFEILRSISRVGPRTALAILTTFRPRELVDIAREASAASLMKVSGIGQKTAQHILLELKYKLKSGAKPTRVGDIAPVSSIYGDVLAALSSLGYEDVECSAIVRKIMDTEPDLDEQEILRAALKTLAKG